MLTFDGQDDVYITRKQTLKPENYHGFSTLSILWPI